MNKKNVHAAFSLIEVLLGLLIFALFASGIFFLAFDTADSDLRQDLKSEAMRYAEEGLEGTRMIRNVNFLELSSGTHGLQYSGDAWTFSGNSELIQDFYTRTITVEDVYRDGSNNISDTGTLDPSTKKITSTVSWTWKGFLPQSVSLTTYLTDWAGNQWTQTTCTEFSAGTYSSTQSTGASSPPANNCVLTLTLQEQQSSFFKSVDVGDHGNDVVVSGNYAYLGTDKQAQGLAISNISNINSPTLVTQFDVGGKARYLSKSGNTLYMGVETSSKGLAIVDVTNVSSPVLKSQTNVGGYGNQSVVVGNYLYMGVEDSTYGFYIYDISNPTSPVRKSRLSVGGAVTAVQVSGNYAYIGTKNSSKEFQIVNISNPSSPSVSGYLNLASPVQAVALNGVTAYLGLDQSSNSFNTVNITNVSSPSLISPLEVGGEIQDVGVLGNYAYVALDVQGTGLGVVNIVSPNAPFLSFTQDVQGKGTGVSVSGNYVYISLDTSNKGLVITGTTVTAVSASGTYVSSILDTGSADTLFNYLSWSATQAAGGTIRLQMRTADTAVNIGTALFVGSDGTVNTYYTASPSAIVLDPNRTGQRYAQVKVYLTSDGANSPAVDSFTLDYDP
jgi:type II secretory pathway pseudopilin PulG